MLASAGNELLTHLDNARTLGFADRYNDQISSIGEQMEEWED